MYIYIEYGILGRTRMYEYIVELKLKCVYRLGLSEEVKRLIANSDYLYNIMLITFTVKEQIEYVFKFWIF